LLMPARPEPSTLTLAIPLVSRRLKSLLIARPPTTLLNTPRYQACPMENLPKPLVTDQKNCENWANIETPICVEDGH
jgi:hypothetical protein